MLCFFAEPHVHDVMQLFGLFAPSLSSLRRFTCATGPAYSCSICCTSLVSQPVVSLNKTFNDLGFTLGPVSKSFCATTMLICRRVDDALKLQEASGAGLRCR